MALVVVQVCFGLLPLFVKRIAAAGISPLGIASWRIATGALVFFLAACALYPDRIRRQPREYGLLILCAAFGVVINQVLALEGMLRSSSTEAGLIMTLIPVFTFALAAAVRQERFELRRAIGIPVALCGALLLLVDTSFLSGILSGQDTVEESHLFGNFLMACNCLSYAGYLVLSRRVLRKMPPLVLVGWVYVFAASSLTLLTPGEALLPSGDARTVSTAWTALGLVLLLPTLLAYGLNTFALARLPASVTAVYIYLQPLVAGLAGYLWLDEHLRPALPIAALLLFLGIALVTRPFSAPRKPSGAAPNAGSRSPEPPRSSNR